MNLSELFIRRPVLTVLLNAAIVVAGVIAYSQIPVAALPSYNTPVINVSAQLPGASPETMATSVALQLEKQFQTIPGLAVISSTNTLGSTSVTLEFDQGRDIDAAAVDVQAALLRAQRQLPQDMTVPPSYRKVNPADAPVLFIAMTSPSLSLSDLNDFAEHLISPTLSTLDGVAQVNIFGQKRFAVRVRVAARRAGGAQHQPRRADQRAARGQRQHAGRHARRPAADADAAGEPAAAQRRRVRRADRQQPQGGNTVRLRDVAQVEDSFETVKTAASFNGETLDLAGDPAPARRQHGQGGRRGARRAARASSRSCRSRCGSTPVNDRSVSIRDALHDVTLTMLGTIVLVVLVIFLFLRRFVATVIPTLSLPVSLVGAVSLLWALRLHARQHLAARPDARGRPGRRRRDRHAREHHAPRRGRRAAVPGGAARLARGRLHHHLDLELAGRGVHPDLLHAGRDRPAVPRVRGHRLARDRRLGVRLADAGADAGEPLPDRRGAQEAAGRAGALVRARLRRAARRLHAHRSTSRCATAASCCWSRCSPSSPRRGCSSTSRRASSREEDIGQITHHDRGGRGHLVPGDGAAAGAASPRSCAPTRTSATVNSFNGGGGVAEHRPHVHQPEAARRAASR